MNPLYFPLGCFFMRIIKQNICHLLILTMTLFQGVIAENVAAIESANSGVLSLTVLDADSKQIVPARIEVLDSSGNSYIADDAMLVSGDCGTGLKRTGVIEETYDGTLEDALSKFTRSIKPPYSDATHFYSSGNSILKLPEGNTIIKVFKGPEYYIGKAEVQVQAGKITKHTIRLARLDNLPDKGWYSADDHLHIARIHKGVDPYVIKMMQAEDIHVGNMLQMGRSHSFSVTPQYAHGPDSFYQEGNYIIGSGQENLRTHSLGHTITLGAKEKLSDLNSYLNYSKFWQQAVDQNAINGFAHMADSPSGYVAGLPLFLHYNLMHFIEVLQLNHAQYGAWYDMLNLGFRITPTAGTDYPCLAPNLPGKERFYTKVDGPLNYDKWLESVQLGKTFVTTGPLLMFRVEGKDIGDEIQLDGPTSITIEAEVIYDPERDSVDALELIENGRIVYSFPKLDDSGKISFKIQRIMDESSWLALRVNHKSWRPIHSFSIKRETDAHTAPIYITLKNAPSLASHPRTKDIAKSWLAILDSLALQLSDKHINHFADVNEEFGHLVPREVTLNSQEFLLDEVDRAREFFNSFPK